MSRDGSISFEWGDGEYKFRLPIGQLQEIQENKYIDAGPEWIFGRLESGRWFVDDVVQTIRLGLIGGGMESAKALTLVKRYAGPGMLMENVQPAMKILAAALVGAPDESPKKGQGEAEMTPAPSPTGNGALRSSTETAP